MNKALLSCTLAVFAVSCTPSYAITHCSEATTSNKKARSWERRYSSKPGTDSKYLEFINKSPWCEVIAGDLTWHKRIMHKTPSGKLIEIQIHKLGESQWISSNWRTLKRECVVPHMEVGQLVTAKYRKPKKGHSPLCVIFKKKNQQGRYRLHQHGLGKVLHSLKHRRRR